jgi:hypothetical protein
MIPPFQDNGYLPPGIHQATIDEVEARFGLEPEIRRVQMESISWLVELAKQARIARLILNGSFVTDIYEPNDVDCVLLLGPDESRNEAIEDELDLGLPFLHIDLLEQAEYEVMVRRVFAFDRAALPIGMMEVILWSWKTNMSWMWHGASLNCSKNDSSNLEPNKVPIRVPRHCPSAHSSGWSIKWKKKSFATKPTILS